MFFHGNDDFLKHTRQEYRQYNKKTGWIAVIIFVAIIGATIFIGWANSSKSATEQDALAPQINFELQEDILKASSFNNIKSWHYIGPRNQAVCDSSLFNETLPFGQTFKSGNQIRVEYNRDNGRYYCFRAIDNNNQAGFSTFHLDNLTKPFIEFKLTKTNLQAQLSSHADKKIYSNYWQHVILNNPLSACNQLAFNNDQLTIIDSNVANLSNLNQDAYFCFRISKLTGGYDYQAKLIKNNISIKPNINVYRLNDKLYLEADQSIRNWQVILVNFESQCNQNSINIASTKYISSQQLAIIRLQQVQPIYNNFCIQAQNQQGIFSHQYYVNDYEQQNSINIQANLDLSNQTLNLQAQTSQPINNWQIKSVSSVSNCLNKFNNYPVLRSSSSVTINYPVSQTQIYCWQAVDINDNNFYTTYTIKPQIISLRAYQFENAITGISLRSQTLNNWQFITQTQQPTTQNCNSQNFSNASTIKNGQRASLVDGLYYCFRATDQTQTYYSQWLKGVAKANQQITEDKIALSHDLKLTNWGKVIFYQNSVKFHTRQQDLSQVCPLTTSYSCYNHVDQTIHIYKHDITENRLNQLKIALLHSLRYKLLNSEQLQAQNSLLHLTYDTQSPSIKRLDAKNIVQNSFYQSQFEDNLYNLIIESITNDPNQDQSVLSDWRDYYLLIFKQ